MTDAPVTTNADFARFLLWEKTTHDVIDFKKIYVDMAGDVLAGLVLSEIIFWYLPKHDGNPKMRVQRDGTLWIACARNEWWDRTRMSPRQADRAIQALIASGLVHKKMYLFNGLRTMHLRLDQDAFLQQWNALVNDPLSSPYETDAALSSNETVTPNYQTVTPSHQSVTQVKNNQEVLRNGETEVTKTARPITETTTETTKSRGIARTPAREDADDTEALRHRFEFYKAFEDAFPGNAKVQVNDTRNHQAQACKLYRGQFTPQQVTELVKDKLADGKTEYRFIYLHEDLTRRLKLVPKTIASPPPIHTASAELREALAQQTKTEAVHHG